MSLFLNKYLIYRARPAPDASARPERSSSEQKGMVRGSYHNQLQINGISLFDCYKLNIKYQKSKIKMKVQKSKTIK